MLHLTKATRSVKQQGMPVTKLFNDLDQTPDQSRQYPVFYHSNRMSTAVIPTEKARMSLNKGNRNFHPYQSVQHLQSAGGNHFKEQELNDYEIKTIKVLDDVSRSELTIDLTPRDNQLFKRTHTEIGSVDCHSLTKQRQA